MDTSPVPLLEQIRVAAAPVLVGITVCLIVVTLYLERRWRQWWEGEHKAHVTLQLLDEFVDVSQLDDEELCAYALQQVPGSVDEAVGEVVKAPRRRRRQRRQGLAFLGSVAQMVRMQFGPVPDRTKANEILAWQRASEILETLRRTDPRYRHNRPTNAGFHQLPIIVELVFTPTMHDVAAARFRRSAAVRARHAEMLPSRFPLATPWFVVSGLCALLLTWSWL